MQHSLQQHPLDNHIFTTAMSTTPVSTVAIAGITGKLGSLIAQSLLTYPRSHIRGLCRNPTKLSPSISSNPRVSITQGPSSDLAVARTFVKGSDVVICAYLGDNDFMVDSQKLLIDAAEAEQVPRYIASDWALDYTKLKVGDLPAKDPMIEIKSYLETKKSVKGVHVLNGAFMELFEMAFQQKEVGYWGTGEERWDMTSYEDCAGFTAAAAMDPSATGVIKGMFYAAFSKSTTIANSPSSSRRSRLLQRRRQDLRKGAG